MPSLYFSVTVIVLLIVGIIYLTRNYRLVRRTKQMGDQDLDEAHRRLNLITEAVGILAWDYHIKSEKYRILYGGCKKKKVDAALCLHELVHPDDLHYYTDFIARLINGEIPNDKEVVEVRFLKQNKKDEYAYYRGSVLLIRDAAGKPESIAGAFIDISKRKNDEAIIQQNLEFLYTILDNIPFPVHVKDVENDDIYIFWNETSKNLFGDCTGKHLSTLLEKEQADMIDNIDRKICKTGEYYHDQETLRMLDGRVIETIAHKSVINDGDKYLVLTVCWVIDDLLRLKRDLEEMCHLNEIIINNTNSGLAYITTDYIVQWENISLCADKLAFETYKKGEFCYKSAYGREEPCEGCLLQKVLSTGQIGRKQFAQPNERQIEVLANPVLMSNGEIEGIVIRVDDITEQQEILENLTYAKQKAEESAKLQSAFIANMSHEIRTPLNAIVGFSGLLVDSDNKEERELFGRLIQKNNDMLLRLVNNILDLSKIESGMLKFNLVDVDLNSLFNEIVFTFQSKMKDSVTLVSEIPCRRYVTKIDPERLVQILTNFLINSIKFTQKGQIKIGYECMDNGIQCYVTDTGIGIAPENFDKIFNHFYKVDSFTQGAGLGLSICKAIVEAYGGKIGLNSEIGKGSTFWIWLPSDLSVLE